MPYMYSEMQNKLSKIRESPLDSMGQIISSRCPIWGKVETVDFSDTIAACDLMLVDSNNYLSL